MTPLGMLISRAREKCVVYSNFTAADLALEGTTSKGLLALKAFLDFAQTRRLSAPAVHDDESEVAFEDALAAELRARGWEVVQRIGYERIASLERDEGRGIGAGKAIAIGVASGVGAFLGTLLILIATID